MFKRIYFFYLTYLVAMVYSQTLLMLWFFKNGISFAEMFFLFYFINLERPCSDAISYNCLLSESLFKKINFISNLLLLLECLPHPPEFLPRLFGFRPHPPEFLQYLPKLLPAPELAGSR